MICFLAAVLIKDYENYDLPSVRRGYGLICASAGIMLNLVLFFVKLFAGSISGSVAVTVDAFHNLTDMCSSFVTLVSFLLPEKNKNIKENIVGSVIGIVLIVAGAELACASVEKIISPEAVECSVLSVLLLLLSVTVKFYMAAFNRKIGKKIGSSALKAASLDCLCDSIATAVAAAAVIASKFTDINIDAIGGVFVSLFILFAGCKTVAESVKALISAVKDKIGNI